MAMELSEKQIKDGRQILKFGEIAKNIPKHVEPSETDLNVYVGLEHLNPQPLRITRQEVPADVSVLNSLEDMQIILETKKKHILKVRHLFLEASNEMNSIENALHDHLVGKPVTAKTGLMTEEAAEYMAKNKGLARRENYV